MAEHDGLLERIIEVLSESDLDRVLGLILDAVVERTGARHGYLVLREKSGIDVRAARNLDRKDIENPEFEISRSLLKQVFEARKPVRDEDRRAERGPVERDEPAHRAGERGSVEERARRRSVTRPSARFVPTMYPP